MRRFDKKKNIQKANQLAEQRYLKSKGLINEIGPETAAKAVSFGNDPRQERVLKDATNSLFSKYLNNSDTNFLFITGEGQNAPSKYILTDVITNVRAKTVLFKFYNEGGDDEALSYSSDKMNIDVTYSIDDDEFSNEGRYGGGYTNQYTANFFVNSANMIRKIYYKLNPPTIDYKDKRGEPQTRPDTEFDIKSRRKKQDFKLFEGGVVEDNISKMTEMNFNEDVEDNNFHMIVSKIAKEIYSLTKKKGLKPFLDVKKFKKVVGDYKDNNISITVNDGNYAFGGSGQKTEQWIHIKADNSLNTTKIYDALYNKYKDAGANYGIEVFRGEDERYTENQSGLVLRFVEKRKVDYKDEDKSKKQKAALAKKVGQSSMSDVERAKTGQVNLELKSFVKKIYSEFKKAGVDVSYTNYITDKHTGDEKGNYAGSFKGGDNDQLRLELNRDKNGQNFLGVIVWGFRDEKDKVKDTLLKMMPNELEPNISKWESKGHILFRMKPRGRKEKVTENN